MVVLAFHTLWSLPQGFDSDASDSPNAAKDTRVLINKF